MGNNNLLERPIQFLIPLELHSEISETDQHEDAQMANHQQSDRNENCMQKSTEKRINQQRGAKQRAISKIKTMVKDLEKDDFTFLDTSC